MSSVYKWRFEENPPLQHLLTFIFFAQVAFILQMLWVEAPHPDQILHPLAILGIATVICSGFVFVVNGVSASVIAYLKRELVRRKLVTSMPVHSAALLKKWQDRSWQLIVHVSMTAFEIYVLCTDLSGVWQNPDLAWTPDPFTYKPTFAIRLLYIIQFAIWICTAVNHRFLADPGYDYYMLFTHHIATLFLLAGSYYLNYVRIGVSVLLVHDMSDIFLDAQKLVQYTKLRSRRGFYASESFFIVNMLSYFYLLLYVLPFFIIRSTFVKSYFIVLEAEYERTTSFGEQLLKAISNFFSDKFFAFSWGPCNVILFTLVCFHIIWSKMFLKRLARITRENLSETFVKEYERRESGSLSDSIFQEVPEGSKGNKSD